jgi:poly-beta-1,6-N-acetyl-D-glucosamine synthase
VIKKTLKTTKKPKPRQVSIGICAHNEEQNIGHLIKSILKQKLSDKFAIREIIVVSSGSTDNTNSIVKNLAISFPKIKLITESKQRGKARAVNKFISTSKSKYLVLTSADVIMRKGSLEILLQELSHRKIGLTAGRIVPVNNQKNLVTYAVQLLWLLHHQINIQYPDRPKVGELIAFKKIFNRILPTISVDEATIEPLIQLQGYKIKYCGNAIINNKGPATIREFLSQRRRIYAGHTDLRKRHGYTVVTYSNVRVLGTLLANLEWNLSDIFNTSLVIMMEAIARFVGLLDYHFSIRDYMIWSSPPTTKRLIQKTKRKRN